VARWQVILVSVRRNGLSLFFLGLGLYWGDGSKNELLPVTFSNSDPHAIAAYLAFLEKTGANLEKLSASLVIHEVPILPKARHFGDALLVLDQSGFT